MVRLREGPVPDFATPSSMLKRANTIASNNASSDRANFASEIVAFRKQNANSRKVEIKRILQS
jgi:hypothetical protein